MSPTERLRHDPGTKKQIKDALFNLIYTPINKELDRRARDITLQNMKLGGYSHASFMYKDEIFNFDTVNPLPRKMNRLVPALHADMQQFLKDRKQLNEQELPFVVGFITQVLNSSNEFEDYLRLLPSSVHGPIQEMIDSCPCKHHALSPETVKLLQDKNKTAIELMKKRMVLNLLT